MTMRIAIVAATLLLAGWTEPRRYAAAWPTPKPHPSWRPAPYRDASSCLPLSVPDCVPFSVPDGLHSTRYPGAPSPSAWFPPGFRMANSAAPWGGRQGA